jgi:hypothetical protein
MPEQPLPPLPALELDALLDAEREVALVEL